MSGRGTKNNDIGALRRNNKNQAYREGEDKIIPQHKKEEDKVKDVLEELPWDREEAEEKVCTHGAERKEKPKVEELFWDKEETCAGSGQKKTASNLREEKREEGQQREQEQAQAQEKSVAGFTLIRQGQTLIVRLPAEPDLDLELKSDVLRVGSHGELRDIALGCSVDVNDYKAKKRRGMVEVTLTII